MSLCLCESQAKQRGFSISIITQLFLIFNTALQLHLESIHTQAVHNWQIYRWNLFYSSLYDTIRRKGWMNNPSKWQFPIRNELKSSENTITLLLLYFNIWSLKKEMSVCQSQFTKEGRISTDTVTLYPVIRCSRQWCILLFPDISLIKLKLWRREC